MKTRKFTRAMLGAALALGVGSVMACSAAPPPTPMIGAPTMIVAFTPSVSEAPPPTLLPTVTVAASQPTPVVIVVTATPPPSPTSAATIVRAATTARATAAPAETATPFPEGVPHVFVTALRVEPATPHAPDGGTFFVAFDNQSGQDDGSNWAVEIWDTENVKRPFGLTTPQNSPLPVGVSNLTSTGWTVKGLGACHAYRARVVARDDEDNRMPFLKPDGSILWLDFTVCP